MQSENINELVTALAKAQGQMRGAVKDSTNPHFKSRYADLASVWEACREPLCENGLAVIQTMGMEGDKQALVTTLGHSSGQWIRSTVVLPLQKGTPQDLGSCITYCRRYALAAMVGIFQEDDDGERAEKAYTPVKSGLTAQMEATLKGYFDVDHEAARIVCERLGIEQWRDMPQSKFGDILKWLRDRKQEAKKDYAMKEEVI